MAYRKVLRPARWILAVVVTGFGISLAGIAVLYPKEGASRVVVGLSLLSVLFLIGMLDCVVSKIVLGEETLDIIELLRRRSYPRREIVSVKVEGGKVCLERERERWIVLPDTGRNALGVRNSIRAWLEEKTAPIHPKTP